MREDVVNALAGELGREGAARFRQLRIHRVIRVGVAGVQQFLDDAAGNDAAVGGGLFARGGFTVGEIDLLDGGVGVEIA